MVRISESQLQQITKLAKDGYLTVNTNQARIINLANPILGQDAVNLRTLDGYFGLKSINTTAPLAGGGNLSQDRTLTIATVSSTSSGVLTASGTTDGVVPQYSTGTSSVVWSLIHNNNIADVAWTKVTSTPTTLAGYNISAGSNYTSLISYGGKTGWGKIADGYISDVSWSKITGAPNRTVVTVVSTSNITLSGTQTIDDVSIGVGKRVLCVGQTNQIQNGIWVSMPSAWVRPSDFSGGAGGLQINVNLGTKYANTIWMCTNGAAVGGDTIDTNNLTFKQVGKGPGWYAIVNGGAYDYVQPDYIANSRGIELNYDSTTGTLAVGTNFPIMDWYAIIDGGAYGYVQPENIANSRGIEFNYDSTTGTLAVGTNFPIMDWYAIIDGGASGYVQPDYIANSRGIELNYDSTTGTLAIQTNFPVPSISGTVNYIAKFTGTSSIGNSLAYEQGTAVRVSTCAYFGSAFTVGQGYKHSVFGTTFPDSTSDYFFTPGYGSNTIATIYTDSYGIAFAYSPSTGNTDRANTSAELAAMERLRIDSTGARVIGVTDTDTLRMRTGAANGYLARSDVNGQLIWNSISALGLLQNGAQYYYTSDGFVWASSGYADTYNGYLGYNTNSTAAGKGITIHAQTSNSAAGGDVDIFAGSGAAPGSVNISAGNSGAGIISLQASSIQVASGIISRSPPSLDNVYVQEDVQWSAVNSTGNGQIVGHWFTGMNGLGAIESARVYSFFYKIMSRGLRVTTTIQFQSTWSKVSGLTKVEDTVISNPQGLAIETSSPAENAIAILITPPGGAGSDITRWDVECRVIQH